MLKVEGLVGLVVLALWIYCVIEVIGTREDEVRNLPKFAWVIIVLLFPLVGSIAWLALGRPEPGGATRRPDPGATAYPEYDRPGRMQASNPDDDEAFLRSLRERAEEQRRRYQEQQTDPEQDPPA